MTKENKKWHRIEEIACIDKEKENLIYLERDLAKNNICLALFRGNHDAPAVFKIDNPWRLSIEEACPHIKIIPDYSILNTVDGNILVVGGARSIDKDCWWQMIQLLPQSYNQKRTIMLNYEVLANIYKQRKSHKLDEWTEFCKWIEGLPFSDLITHEVVEISLSDNRKDGNE